MDLIADANHLLARSREHEQRLWRLVAAINAMVDKAAGTRKRLVRIYGALADVWSSGPEGAVLSLETLWHQLIADANARFSAAIPRVYAKARGST